MLSPKDYMRLAIQDYRYLLSHGYRQKVALNLVVNHHKLTEDERHVLARGVLPAQKAGAIRSRLVGMDEVRGKKLVVDGYNVLITVESMIASNVIACDDTLIRDTRGIFGKYKEGPETAKALGYIIDVLREAKPSEALFIFDSQVSLSGQLARKVGRRMGSLGDAATDKQADRRILSEGSIVATADSNLLLKASKAVDIPRKILEERFKTKGVFSTLDVS